MTYFRRAISYATMNNRNIQTFVVFDIETTGLPWQEYNKTKITELALTAVSTENIISAPMCIPRVLHKLAVCINPFKMIQPDSTDLTGLSNMMLEKEKIFNDDLGEMIHLFIKRLNPPVCIVAHNGTRFDFPILQSELIKVGKPFPDDILCADSLLCFQELFSNIPIHLLPLYIQKRKSRITDAAKDSVKETLNASSQAEDRSFMQAINETTPEKTTKAPVDVLQNIKAKRKLFGQVTKMEQDESIPQLQSFKLEDVYKFLTGREVINNHRAETDTLILISCLTIMGEDFVNWANKKAMPFNVSKKLW